MPHFVRLASQGPGSLNSPTLAGGGLAALVSRPVYVYVRNTSTQQPVVPNADGSGTPLTQPIQSDSYGNLPGYVQSGVQVDLFDTVSGARMPLDPLSDLDVIGTDGYVGGAGTSGLPPSVVTDSRGSGAGADVPMNGHTLTGLGPLVLQGGTGGMFADFATGAPGVPARLSDVASSTPFDLVQTDPGGALTYDSSTVLAPMTRSMKITATSAAEAAFGWSSFGKLQSTSYGRAYINMTANPGATLRLVQWLAGAVSKGFIQITGGRIVQICDQAGATVGASTALTTATWYRFEWSVTRESGGGGNGVVTLNIYAGHSITPLQTITSTAFQTGTYIDHVLFGSVNNSNLGAMALYLGAFADGCASAPGPYTGSAPPIAEARNPDGTLDFGGFQVDGKFLLRARADKIGDSSHYKYRSGQPMFRVDENGNPIFGPSLLAIHGSPVGGASVPDMAFNVSTGRLGVRSAHLVETNDPPDLTLTRFGDQNNDRSGTDGTTNGAIFTSATINFQSIDVNKGIVVGGTTYFITSVDSPTQCHLENADGSVAALSVASGVTWSTSYHPYPSHLDGVNSGTSSGQIRVAPGTYAFNRNGTDAVVNGTTTLTSASAAFTSADTGRHIMLNNDVTRIYTLTYVSATTVTLDRADPNTASGVSWSIAAKVGDGGAAPSQMDGGTFGFLAEDLAALWDSGSKNYGPMSAYVTLASKALYGIGADIPVVMRWRSDGRVEIPNRLTLTDPSLTALANAPTDTQLWRSAVARAMTNALIDATSLGLATKVKAGTPADGDWASAPPNGTLVGDSSAGALWARLGGTWVKVAGGVPSTELAYAQITATYATVTATTAATANDVGLTTGAVTYDGTTVIVEFYCPSLDKGTSNITVVLYDGSTQLGTLGRVSSSADACLFRARITPSAGSHTYLPKAYVDAGTGQVEAGDGTIGHQVPAYFRITKAA